MGALRKFWLFQKSSAGLTGGKKAVFWVWNLAVLVMAGLCLGMLSIFFAYGDYPDTLMKTYLARPLILALNIAPVVALVLPLSGPGSRFCPPPWWYGGCLSATTTSCGSGTTP